MSTTARALRRFERESHQYRFLETFIVIFVVILLISNLVGAKIIALGSLRFGGAQVLFPCTYIFGDIFTECTATRARGGRSGWVFSLRF